MHAGFQKSHAASFMWGYGFTALVPETVGTEFRLPDWMRLIFPPAAATCEGWELNDAMIHLVVIHFVCFLQLSLCGSWPGASLVNMPQMPVSASRSGDDDCGLIWIWFWSRRAVYLQTSWMLLFSHLAVHTFPLSIHEINIQDNFCVQHNSKWLQL